MLPASAADLAACAAEPIRVPGAIQPQGWLLASDSVDGRIVAYSDNWTALTTLLDGPGHVAELQSIVGRLRPKVGFIKRAEAPASIGSVTIGGRLLDAMVHRSGATDVFELEPAGSQHGTEAPIYRLARRFVPLIQAAASVGELASFATAEMKAISGFGRCLLYSFDTDGNAEVLAEQRDAGYDSYFGHHFPASDIPAQARELYVRNQFRLISDARYVPVALRFVDESMSAGVLDLSFAHLRSVSPVHLEYMRNMGTLASMSVSIVIRGRLWGLISCHDHDPRQPDVETRAACEHIGRLISMQIEAREDQLKIERRAELRKSTLHVVSRLGQSDASLGQLVDEPIALLALTRATGVAVIFDAQCRTAGSVPAEDRILALAAWIHERRDQLYATDDLHQAGAPDTDPACAAGVLSVSLSDVRRHLVMWFRPEQARSIRWAGEPVKREDAQLRLHPRQSFSSWVETVRGKSTPWTDSEKAGVLELREALIGIVLHRAAERATAAGALDIASLAKDTAERADSAKTQFLAILSHELRTPLGAISSAAELLARFAEVPERFAGLLPMIKRNVALETRLIDDLLDLSAISAGKLNLAFEDVDLQSIVQHVTEMLQQDVAAKDLHVKVEFGPLNPRVRADPVRIQQVLWNILRNAVKFTREGGEIRIRSDVRDGRFVLTVDDDGIGIDAEALRRIFNAFEQADGETARHFGGLGLGLAIAMGLVRGHGGELVASSQGRGHGATFTVSLPIAVEQPG